MTAETKLVDNANFHIWTDALHGRGLARRAGDPWNRGTYVRWCVNSAWTALEMACEDALSTTGLGYRFKDNLDKAVEANGLVPLDWGQGLWQRVLAVHQGRKDYTHPGIPQARLFAEVAAAENAVSLLREAIRAIYIHAKKSPPKWVEADTDSGYPREDPVPNILVHNGGVTRETPGMIRVACVYRGEERDLDWLPPGADWRPVVDKFIAEVRVPVSKVVVYDGPNLIFSLDLPMRGSF